MAAVTSRDGTSIAYTRVGSGPPLIIVDGAMCHRSFGPSAALARELSDRFTVITYGAPALAVLTVVLSFFTARRARGVVLPLISWLLLLVAAAVLELTFP